MTFYKAGKKILEHLRVSGSHPPHPPHPGPGPSPNPQPIPVLTLTCPSTQTVQSNVARAVTYPPATTTGGIAPISIVYSKASGSMFNVGSTTVSVTATSSDGQSKVCSFLVSVESVIPPIPTLKLTCPPTQTVTSSVPIVVTYPAATTTGGTAPIGIVYSANSGSVFGVGTTTVNVTATSTDGQVKTCSFTVDVVAAPPVPNLILTCPATQTVHSNLPISVAFPAATTTGGADPIVIAYSPIPGSVFAVGNTTVTVVATSGDGQVKTCSFVVQVIADPPIQPLVLTCPPTQTVTSSTPVNVTYPAATTTGGQSPILINYSQASGSVFPVALTPVTVTATSADGQVKTCSFSVSVVTTPVATLTVTCPADFSVATPSGVPIAVTYPSASTTGGAAPITLTYYPESGSTLGIGVTNVLVTATSADAQTATCNFNVLVYHPTPPPATLLVTCPVNRVENSVGGTSIPVSYPPATTTGGTAPINLTYSKVSGSTFPMGLTTVSVTAMSADGQTATCSFTVTVQLPPAPGSQRVLNPPADLTWLGTFKNISSTAGAPNGGALLTCRRVGGVLRFLAIQLTSSFFMSDADLVEFVYPGYDPNFASSPVASIIFNYGHGYQPFVFQNGSYSLNQVYVPNLFWDEVEHCVWLQYVQGYSGNNDPFLIRGDINDTSHTVSWSGPWRTAGGSKQAGNWGVIVPTTYANTYLGGRRLAFGAGATSIDAANAFGPALYASAPPAATDPVFPVSAIDIPATKLLGTDFNHRALRPGDYLDVACGGTGDGAVDPTSFSRVLLTGRQNTVCSTQGACWIDWSGVKGVVFPISMAKGHSWYVNAGHGFIDFGTQAGTFAPPEIVTGQTSGATAQTYSWDPSGKRLLWVQDPNAGIPIADFTVGENVIGAISGSHGIVTRMHRNNHCYHEEDGTSAGITGPVWLVDPIADAGQPYGIGPATECWWAVYDPQLFVPIVGGNSYDVQPSRYGYAIDTAVNFRCDRTQAVAGSHGGFTGICADETSRLLFQPAGFVQGGDPFTTWVNVFSVAP